MEEHIYINHDIILYELFLCHSNLCVIGVQFMMKSYNKQSYFLIDHSNYFEATREGAVVTVRNTTSIPPSIFNQQYILLFLQATRPQTVGARTAIVITLPAGIL